MNSKNNRVNHDFQIRHFLAGSCHTADGAYALLCDLREDRQLALDSSEAHRLRSLAKRRRAERRLASDDEAERLDGAADIAELDAFAAVTERNLAAARAELAYIDGCMRELEPLRRFKSLPLPQAHEAAQHDEWRFELIHRAENQLLTTGSINPDHFATMRMHPAFEAQILPEIENMLALLAAPGGRARLLGASKPHLAMLR